MANLNDVNAALAAIQVHTHANRLEDDGNPRDIGSWHLLYSLADYADAKGLDFMSAAKRVRDTMRSEKRMFYVEVDHNRANGEELGVYLQPRRYEVSALSLRKACELVVSTATPEGPDVRLMDIPSAVDSEVKNWSKYAGAGRVEFGFQSSIANAVSAIRRGGIVSEAKLFDPTNDVAAEDFIGATEASLTIFRDVTKVERPLQDELNALVQAVAQYIEWEGGDYVATFDDVVSERGVLRKIDGTARTVTISSDLSGDNMVRLVISGNGANEELLLNNDEFEESSDDVLKMELILDNATSATVDAIASAEVVMLDDSLVDTDELHQLPRFAKPKM